MTKPKWMDPLVERLSECVDLGGLDFMESRWYWEDGWHHVELRPAPGTIEGGPDDGKEYCPVVRDIDVLQIMEALRGVVGITIIGCSIAYFYDNDPAGRVVVTGEFPNKQQIEVTVASVPFDDADVKVITNDYDSTIRLEP